MGVSSLDELEETLRVWNAIVDGLDISLVDEPLNLTNAEARQDLPSAGNFDDKKSTSEDSVSRVTDPEWSRARRQQIPRLVQGAQNVIGEWMNYTWDSPEKDFVNVRLPDHNNVQMGKLGADHDEDQAALLTPPMDARDQEWV